jgi:hypothetical protein
MYLITTQTCRSRLKRICERQVRVPEHSRLGRYLDRASTCVKFQKSVPGQTIPDGGSELPASNVLTML